MRVDARPSRARPARSRLRGTGLGAARLAAATAVLSVLGGLAAASSAHADAAAYDVVVDVTGLSGADACAAMQAALNDALGGTVARKRVLLRGQIGTPDRPADFSMFHDAGRAGAGRRDWPYRVCHAFWPTRNTTPGEGIVDGYPDPLFAKTLAEGRATARSTPDTVDFADRSCRHFSMDRKLAVVVSGRGRGQVRRVTACESDRVARVEPAWKETPDASSLVRIVSHQRMGFGRMDLYVDYDLDVHYRNSRAQGKWRHGVFADVGLACWFVGGTGPEAGQGDCPGVVMDGIHRAGRITVHEYGRRDDGRTCAPTWMDAEHLTNRPYSVIWQALGPGVVRGSDDVRLDIVGEGDRDNIGVLAYHTWTRDFRGWRVKRIGTGVWIAGSLNDTLYDAYLTGNEFGVVVGANTPWGAGWPRFERCWTGFCEPFAKDSVAMSFRGGVLEGNACGNFVMFGGYSGEVDRTFIETGAAGSPGYAGHSVVVGAGVCDEAGGRSPRQGADRRGQVCADDLDCAGSCRIDARARRQYAFAWDAALVSNRGSKDWFAFVLGKGTRREYLDAARGRVGAIRVSGRGLGGERGHPEIVPGEKGGLYFFASDGASVAMDLSAADGTGPRDHLPPYDHYVGMPARDLERVIERPSPGRYLLGRLARRATCTEGAVTLVGGDAASAAWSIGYGPVRGQEAVQLLDGRRVTRGGGPAARFGAREVARPFAPGGALFWLDVERVSGEPDALVATIRCWEDDR